MKNRDRGVFVVRDESGTPRYVGYSFTDLSGVVTAVECGVSDNPRLNAYTTSGKSFEVDVYRMPNAPEADIRKRGWCLILQHGNADQRTGTLWNRSGTEEAEGRVSGFGFRGESSAVAA